MKLRMRIAQSLLVLVTLFAGTARATDLSHAVILVASARLAGSVFEQTVIIATPSARGGHIGFIVNRPTDVKMEALFPEQASTHQVVEPVYAGGPAMPRAVFALTRKPPGAGAEVLPLVPGVVAVVDAETVDYILETRPNDARYFVGLMVWGPEELANQVQSGAWTIHSADVDSVLPADATELWKSLSGTAV